MSAICDRPDCDRPALARRLCSRHYQQATRDAQKAGVPLPPSGDDQYEPSPIRAQLVAELEALRDQLNEACISDGAKLQQMRDYAISFLRMRHDHRSTAWRQVGEII